jgi:hypothetical protein
VDTDLAVRYQPLAFHAEGDTGGGPKKTSVSTELRAVVQNGYLLSADAAVTFTAKDACATAFATTHSAGDKANSWM